MSPQAATKTSVRLRDLAVSRKDMLMVDPTLIVVRDGWNVRVESPELQAHIDQLAASMGNIGFLSDKPLTVYLDNGAPVLTDGHCRLRAVLKARSAGADITAVPVVIEPKGNNEADRVAGILTRNAGKPLTVLEAGAVYKRLVGYGWSIQRIADTTGKSAQSVNEALTVQEAPPEVHALVAAGEVSASAVINATKAAGNATAGAELVKATVAKTKASNGGKSDSKAVGAAVSKAAFGVTLKLRGAEVGVMRGLLEGVLAQAESGAVNDDTMALINRLLPLLPETEF